MRITSKAKKSLGQNFLENKSVLQRIAAALAPRSGETIIEIGPGHGELTQELRRGNRELRILAIEKDERLVGLLQERFKNDRNVEIVAGDALKLLPLIVSDTKYQILNTKYSVVGNIPYYITGYLLRVLSELEPKPKNIVLLTQKEVAERVCASPPKMNLLAASVQCWAEPKILMYVGRKNFRPVPKVDSAVVRMVPKNETLMEPDVFYPFLRVLFKQPRKTVLNNLKAYVTDGDLAARLERSGLDPRVRPQDLPLDGILRLLRGIKSGDFD